MIQGQLGANTHAVTRDLERALEELKPLLAAEEITLHPQLFRPPTSSRQRFVSCSAT